MTLAERLPLPSKLGLAAALGSGALLGGAYYFQYVMGLSPCEMCYWQRYPHMVAIIVGLLSLASFAWPRLALVFMLTAPADRVEECVDAFAARGLTAARIGTLDDTGEVRIATKSASAVVFDLARESVTRLGR